MTEDHRPLYHRLSLRARMVLITAAFVTAVLLVGGIALLATARAALVDGATDNGEIRAADIASLAASGRLPPRLPRFDDGEALTQVVLDGRVISTTEARTGLPVVDAPRVSSDEVTVLSVETLPIDADGPFRIIAREVQTPAGRATVLVVISLVDLEEAINLEARLGAVGLPVLVLALSIGMWTVLGRTLAPVEAIRRQADAISGRDLHRRVPEPARQDEVGRLARTVNAMLARLQDSAERQHRFVADAAHELRSPVTSLRTQLETAGEGTSLLIDSDLRDDLIDETVRMETLVEQLLLLARADAAGVPPRRLAFDLDEAVEAAVRVSGGRTAGRIAVDVGAVEPVQMIGDPDLIGQVARNLLDNAIRHAESRIRVTVGSEGDRAVLTVDDDGPGIPVDRREDVFQRFTRLDTGRDRDSGGVGLGLAIVAEIVRIHGGSVDIESGELGGALFRVRLPLRPAAG